MGTICPGASREKEMFPAPWVSVTKICRPGEEALHRALERAGDDVHLGLLPEQRVVLEVDVVAAAEQHVDHGHELAFDLHGHVAGAEDLAVSASCSCGST